MMKLNRRDFFGGILRAGAAYMLPEVEAPVAEQPIAEPVTPFWQQPELYWEHDPLWNTCEIVWQEPRRID